MTRTKFQDVFSQEVWESTYKDHNDKNIDDTHLRIATVIASVEETDELKEVWAANFLDMLRDFKVTPGGRIISNAGTEWGGTTLINCYVAPRYTKDVDSLDSILGNLKNQSNTLKSEGGWGENFSYIRPRGSFIHGIGVETPGAVKFMETFDKTSDVITSGSGKASTNSKAKKKIRKGAMMGVLDCFADSTSILTSAGWINVVDVVEMLEEGKEVMIIGEDGQQYPAKNPVTRPKEQLVRVETEDGSFIETTLDHKFEVQNVNTGEVYLKALRDIDPDTELMKIVS